MYKRGDRVILNREELGILPAGSKGTVLEANVAPYVSWDNFTSGHAGGLHGEYPEGSSWCVAEEQLSPLEEEK